MQARKEQQEKEPNTWSLRKYGKEGLSSSIF
jgi:hypothetical protein